MIDGITASLWDVSKDRESHVLASIWFKDMLSQYTLAGMWKRVVTMETTPDPEIKDICLLYHT